LLLNKNTTSTPPNGNWLASGAVDGWKCGNENECNPFVSFPKSDGPNWMNVDIGFITKVYIVKVYPRIGDYFKESYGIDIYVGNSTNI
jgi:hypothetical protein